MRNKFLIYLSIVFLLLAIAVGSWWLLHNNTDRRFYSLIPKSAILITDIADMSETSQQLTETDYWFDLQRLESVRTVSAAYQLMDSILLSPPIINDTIEQVPRRLLSSLHLTGPKAYDMLFLLPAEHLKAELSDISEALKAKGVKVDQRTFKNTSIFQWKLNKQQGNTLFTLAQKGEVIIASFSPTLVDESLSQAGWGFGNGFWWKSNKRQAAQDATLYFNFKRLVDLELALLNTEENSFFDQLAGLVDWAYYHIRFEEGGIKLEGKCDFKRNDLFFADLLSLRSHSEFKIAKYAPKQTAFLLHAKSDEVVKFTRSKGGNTAKQFRKHIEPWLGNEWAFGFTEPHSDGFATYACALLHTTDPKAALENLPKLSSKSGPPESASEYKGFQIHSTDAESCIGHLFGPAIGQYFSSSYYLVMNDMVILSEQASILRSIIDQQLNKEGLHQEAEFKRFLAASDPRNNLNLYLSPKRLENYIRQHLSADAQKTFNQNFEFYQHLAPLSLSFDQDASGKRSTGMIGYGIDQAIATDVIWRVPLSTTVANTPFLVDDHTTNEQVVLVQDTAHHLYLVERSGKIRWTKAMQSPILGKIQTVDYYDNGKKQYLFNTADFIYLIDHEGKSLNNFPIKLTAEASAGMSIAKSTQDGHMRFFVPCFDRIYGYKFNGRPLAGWSPLIGIGEVYHQLTPLPTSDSFELIAVNKKGKLYYLDMSGTETHSIDLKSALVSDPELRYLSGIPHCVISTKNGKHFAIDVNKRKQNLKIGNKKRIDGVFTANLIGDAGVLETAVLSGNSLQLYSRGKRLGSHTIPKGKGKASIFPVGNLEEGQQIGVHCPTTNELFLIGKYGNPHPDCPLNATTPFVAGHLFGGNDLVVIAGDGSDLVAYRLK